jgi:hypothetical protein
MSVFGELKHICKKNANFVVLSSGKNVFKGILCEMLPKILRKTAYFCLKNI